MAANIRRKVLALHGYSQSATAFNKKTGATRRCLRKENIDLVYIEAPCELQQDQVHGTISEGETARGWFKFDDTKYYGVQEAIDLVSKQLEEEGPFDGILAFSQGACLAGILCAKHSLTPLRAFENVKFVIFVSSFMPTYDTPEKQYFDSLLDSETKINIPTFHFYGASDKVITPDRSVAFANMFIDPVVYEHPGGHFVPANGEPMRQLRAFVQKVVDS